MFKFSVVILSTNMSGGVSKDMILCDTQREAENKYYDTLSKLGGNEQTKYLRVELKDEDGNLILVNVRKNDEIIESIEE